MVGGAGGSVVGVDFGAFAATARPLAATPTASATTTIGKLRPSLVRAAAGGLFEGPPKEFLPK